MSQKICSTTSMFQIGEETYTVPEEYISEETIKKISPHIKYLRDFPVNDGNKAFTYVGYAKETSWDSGLGEDFYSKPYPKYSHVKNDSDGNVNFKLQSISIYQYNTGCIKKSLIIIYSVSAFHSHFRPPEIASGICARHRPAKQLRNLGRHPSIRASYRTSGMLLY